MANAQLGNVNQYGPDGSVTYSTSGYKTITDPTSGATYNIPQYDQHTTLSAAQQAIKNQTDAASLNLGKIANNQSAFLNSYLGKPVDLSSSNIEKYVNDHFSDDFNKQQDQQLSDLTTRLSNQGVKLGSDAYTRALADFNTSRGNAYDNMIGNQYNSAVQQILTQRNQPLNEITALLGGSQVGTPQFGANANTTSLPTVDYAGLVNQDYQNKLGVYNQQQAQSQGLLGGLFGLGGNILSLSDKRAKKNIKKIGKANGHGLYSYEYKKGKGPEGKQVGVMAQEVARKRPDAVAKGKDGLLRVNYGKLFSAGENVE